mmetsp:Transcript_24830/g.59081  ORF Transcript_24830/g.59081 Transcript_24830/m.59081 type:complete len:237 (-) Transcript_24830:249-959(-)
MLVGVLFGPDSVHIRVVGAAHGDLGDLLDVGRHGGGEEQALPRVLRRQLRQHLEDRRPEPHVQQLIRLVEDEDAEVREQSVEARVGQVVVEAAGRRDQDVGRVLEALKILPHICPADNALQLEPLVELAEHHSFVHDLLCELAGGRDCEHFDLARSRRTQARLNRRDEEGECLARASLRLSEHVHSRERHRQRLLLHHCHELVSKTLSKTPLAQRVDVKIRKPAACHLRKSRLGRA